MWGMPTTCQTEITSERHTKKKDMDREGQTVLLCCILLSLPPHFPLLFILFLFTIYLLYILYLFPSYLLASSFPSILPSILPSFLPSFHPSFLPSILPSILPSFIPSFLPSLPSPILLPFPSS